MKADLLKTIAAEANLAPSTHNTQPVDWRMDGPDALRLCLNPERDLPVGDPSGDDARLSGGAALHGTLLALWRRGIGVRATEWDAREARIVLGGEPQAALGLDLLQKRTCYRAGFGSATDAQKRSLQDLVKKRSDVSLVAETPLMTELAELNDAVSLTIMRDRAFRRELLQWMRLNPGHPCWSVDGLSAEALGMGRFTARAAGLALSGPGFALADLVGLSRMVVSEKPRTLTATAYVLFHRPVTESRWHSGTAFYDLWLRLTAIGFAAWPMAALVDDADAHARLARSINLPANRALVSALRVGPHPGERQPQKARRAAADLVKDA